jgi:hypothetical protein
MSAARMVIERATTRDRVLMDCGPDGREIGWTCIPAPPPGRGWVIYDASPDDATRWRRIRLVAGDGGAA